VDPGEQEWLRILEEARREPARNRVMLALAYDAALRREELCSLRTDDVDPAHRMLRVRAETTKNRLERVVPYSAPTGVLLSQYLATGPRSAGPGGRLFLSESRRNHAEPLSLWTWSKVVRRIALASGGRAVLHAHDPAPVPDGPGQDGLGGPRDRRVRRAPVTPTPRCAISTCPGGSSPRSSASSMSQIHAWRVGMLTDPGACAGQGGGPA
jgi:integrase/recombinase XerD